MNKNNLRIARDAGYKARYDHRARRDNPFPNDASWASLRGAWYDGWDTAEGEQQ
jgi:hypothetical protein